MAAYEREDKTFYNFILSFFRIQAILYTQIGIDDLEELMSKSLYSLN